MNTTPTSPWPVRVRPQHHETEASYTTRVLAANFEDDAHKRALIREVSKHGGSTPRAWVDVLTAKTGRTFHFAEIDDLAKSPTATHICEFCPDIRRSHTMCRLCAGGAHVEQAEAFYTPICIHHHRWTGPTPDIRIDAHQPTVDADVVRAGIKFDRLQRQGRMTPALFHVLRTAARPRQFGTPIADLDAATLPVVVNVAAAVTTKTFVGNLFAPGLTYAEAYQRLETAVREATDENSALAPALWVFFKPTFWALRHAVRTNTRYTPAWEHDYTLPEATALAYTAEFREEPFTNYLAAVPGKPLHATSHNILERDGMTICAEGHHVKASKHCPVCKNSQVATGYNDLATVNPKVASQLDPVLNGTVTAQTIAAATHKDLAWRCPREGHVYWATGSARTQGKQNCGICSGRTTVPGVNDITTTHPTIAAEIHPDYAKAHPPAKILAGSEIKPEWLCPTCGRTYKMTAYDRTHSEGCDPCRRDRLRASKENLAATHPHIAAQWHPSRNNNGGPEFYSHGSNESVYWLCQTTAAHWYEQRIDRKVAGYGCSICSNRKLVLRVNDLATTDPLLVMEFHPTLNGAKKPELMFAGTDLHYWKCLEAGHVKKQSVPNRRKSMGCTDCEREDRILA